MSEIADLAEGEAFMNAVDDILGLNHPLRDAEIARLRQAWVAGRDYALAAATASGEAERLRAALEGLAMRSFFSDGTFCWCDGPVYDAVTHQHIPGCIRAREALADRAAGEREG